MASWRSSSRERSRERQRGAGGFGASNYTPTYVKESGPRKSDIDALIRERNYESAARMLGRADAATQKIVDTSQIVKGLLGQSKFTALCALLVAYKDAQALRAPRGTLLQMIGADQLDSVGFYIKRFELEGDSGVVDSFIGALVAKGKFTTAIDQAKELVKGFLDETPAANGSQKAGKWTLATLLQAMIDAGHYESALKCIQRYKVTERFPPEALIDRLVARKEHRTALRYAQKMRVSGDAYTPDAFYARMVQDRQWKVILSLRESMPEFEEKYPVASVVRSAIDVGDIAAALDMFEDCKVHAKETAAHAAQIKKLEAEHTKLLAAHGQPAAQAAAQADQRGQGANGAAKLEAVATTLERAKKAAKDTTLTYLVHSLIGQQEYHRALKLVVTHDIFDEFSAKDLIMGMMEVRQYQFVLRYLFELDTAHIGGLREELMPSLLKARAGVFEEFYGRYLATGRHCLLPAARSVPSGSKDKNKNGSVEESKGAGGGIGQTPEQLKEDRDTFLKQAEQEGWQVKDGVILREYLLGTSTEIVTKVPRPAQQQTGFETKPTQAGEDGDDDDDDDDDDVGVFRPEAPLAPSRIAGGSLQLGGAVEQLASQATRHAANETPQMPFTEPGAFGGKVGDGHQQMVQLQQQQHEQVRQLQQQQLLQRQQFLQQRQQQQLQQLQMLQQEQLRRQQIAQQRQRQQQQLQQQQQQQQLQQQPPPLQQQVPTGGGFNFDAFAANVLPPGGGKMQQVGAPDSRGMPGIPPSPAAAPGLAFGQQPSQFVQELLRGGKTAQQSSAGLASLAAEPGLQPLQQQFLPPPGQQLPLPGQRQQAAGQLGMQPGLQLQQQPNMPQGLQRGPQLGFGVQGLGGALAGGVGGMPGMPGMPFPQQPRSSFQFQQTTTTTRTTRR